MKNIKIILLSPVVFDKHNHDLVEQVTLKLYEENEVKIFSDNEWETLDGEEVCLNNTDGAIDIRDAIWKIGRAHV